MEYRLIEFCELLSLKETRVKVLMKALIESGKVETLGANRNRRYNENHKNITDRGYKSYFPCLFYIVLKNKLSNS